MDTFVGYFLVVFSPVLFLQLLLSLRYIAVNEKLREHHSKKYIKKHYGNLWEYLNLLRFRKELPKALYFSYEFILWVILISVPVAIVYGILWLAGCPIFPEWLPWLYVGTDIILCFCNLVLCVREKLAQR